MFINMGMNFHDIILAIYVLDRRIGFRPNDLLLGDGRFLLLI